ncbi:MAG: alpha/beta hydrolase [Bacteroidales bacterium]|nr:alpha/beta hydrolase [Bacteroidales bacterium]
MESSRIYGNPPVKIVLIHGGPGAPGSLAPVAKKLSETAGILEILNCAKSIKGQLFEIYEEVIRHCDLPVIIIGHSWGAWLSWIFTAKFPNLVGKLVLIGSPPFTSDITHEILSTRMKRLEEDEQKLLAAYLDEIDSHANPDRLFAKIGKLIAKADTLSSLSSEDQMIEYQYDVFRKVWTEAEEMRRSGKLPDLAGKINCPVVAIHGNYDPHPFQGVHQPLSKIIKDFKMHIIDKCGHYPWNEEFAADDFYSILQKIISSDSD